LVQEADGHPLPGATMTLLRSDGVTAVKVIVLSADGSFRFHDLSAGNYFLKCQLSGFFDEVIGPIPIQYGKHGPDVPRLKIQMVAGPVQY